ncbi:MAG: hypothetical protein ACOX8R_05170 [Bacillota bacterium]|jgi:hypothetical protein
MRSDREKAFGYSGRIGNAGSQKVNAPFAAVKTAKGKVIKNSGKK